jgi:molybdopterin-containing oxidoreductase family iron-sulfur binding subunit
MEEMLTPQVSTRMRGVVEKCTFCVHRLQLAKDKAFLEGLTDLTGIAPRIREFILSHA